MLLSTRLQWPLVARRAAYGLLSWWRAPIGVISATIAGSLIASPLSAQGAASVTSNADAITTDEIARHLRVFADDSMQGRGTPGPALERAAAYVAAEFRRFGLTPASSDEAWVQRYNIPGQLRLDRTTTVIWFAAAIRRDGKWVIREDGGPAARNMAVGFDAARPASDLVDLNESKRTAFESVPVMLVAGRQTVQSVRQADLGGTSIVYVPAAGIDSLSERQIVDALVQVGRSVVILSDDDSATFARRLALAQPRPIRLADDYMSGRTGPSSWAAEVWCPAIADVLVAADIDVAAAREDLRPVTKLVPDMAVWMHAQRDTTGGPPLTAPNVVGMLPGTDSTLKGQYIVLTAHLDTDPRDDRSTNTAGVAGLLALAKAFSQPSARPRRPVVFLATSGGAKDWWGARAFAGDRGNASHVMASLHLDAIDRIADDSVAIDGLDDFGAPASPKWIGAAHPELELTVVDGGSVDRSPANHGAFLVRTRPSLAFHATGGRALDSRSGASPISESSLVRVLRLVFYMGHELADAKSRIGWSEGGRRRLQQTTAGDSGD